MKKIIMCLVLLAVSQAGMAGDTTEQEVKTVPLKIYSGGVGAGAMLPLNPEFEEYSERFLKLSFMNMWQFREYTALFLDIDWLAPEKNFGVQAGFDFLLSSSDFRPFFGFGIGGHYFEERGEGFNHNFGPSASAHIGFVLDITDAVQVRFRVPYNVILNESRDHGVGFDMGVMFTDKLRKIRKLDYNG
ncbi:MAG: acyloxyacyl hydrolase [Chitinispirillaceae bacterium]